jgi:hypothetical protein
MTGLANGEWQTASSKKYAWPPFTTDSRSYQPPSREQLRRIDMDPDVLSIDEFGPANH